MGAGFSEEKTYIGVIGSGECSLETFALAEEVGRRIAENGCVLVCGGRTGVMEGACKGARSAGGVTIGILPGDSRADANPYVQFALPSGLGDARNALVVRASDAVIAISGGPGTLSEIGLALKAGIPVVGLKTWALSINGRRYDGIVEAQDPESAVKTALALVRRGRNRALSKEETATARSQ